MDSAKLHNRIVNLQQEEFELMQEGLNERDVKQRLEDKYRSFSRKKAFRCLCCGTPVVMVLNEEGRAHFFRHYEIVCAYSENHNKYEKQVRKYECPTTHRLGLTLIRVILEGQVKPYGVKVTDGYQMKHLLSVIPDILLHFPDGRVWALDYLTGLRTSESYTRWIQRRKDAYSQQRMTPFFFVDYSWIAYHEEFKITSLLPGEQELLQHRDKDEEWTMFLQNLPLALRNILSQEHQWDMNVWSLAYLNPEDRTCQIVRMLPKGSEGIVVTNPPVTISLERALTLNTTSSDFLLFDEEERVLQQELRQLLQIKYDEHEKEMERQRREEEQWKQKKAQHQKEQQQYYKERMDEEQRLLERIWEKAQRSKKEIKEGTYDPNKNADVRSSYEMQRDLERMYAELERRSISTVNQYVSEGNRLKKKKREEMKEKILNIRVKGELYINGPSRDWKEFVLYRFNAIRRGDKTVEQLLQGLKDAGFTFNQKDKHVLHILEDYLEIIEKKLNRIV